MGRRCYKCKLHKELEHFVVQKSRPLGRKYICKICSNQIKRNTNKDNVSKLYKYLLNHPCVDCGASDPLVLQFDHQEDKKENVSKLAGNRSWTAVENEIKKCVVRCANCHQKKTAQDGNFYMSLQDL